MHFIFCGLMRYRHSHLSFSCLLSVYKYSFAGFSSCCFDISKNKCTASKVATFNLYTIQNMVQSCLIPCFFFNSFHSLIVTILQAFFRHLELYLCTCFVGIDTVAYVFFKFIYFETVHESSDLLSPTVSRQAHIHNLCQVDLTTCRILSMSHGCILIKYKFKESCLKTKKTKKNLR